MFNPTFGRSGQRGKGVAGYLYSSCTSKTVQVALPEEPEPQKSAHLPTSK